MNRFIIRSLNYYAGVRSYNKHVNGGVNFIIPLPMFIIIIIIIITILPTSLLLVERDERRRKKTKGVKRTM